MAKIFIVTSGEYSDYHIDAAFSTREKTEEYVDIYGPDYMIKEYEVDVPVCDKDGIWEVRFDMQSGAIDSINRLIFETKEDELLIDSVQYGTYTSGREYIELVLKSDSMSRVKKIASERLMQIKAFAGIKFPYLSKKIVFNKTFGCGEYPYYDYKTGRIILLGKDRCLAQGIEAATENRF